MENVDIDFKFKEGKLKFIMPSPENQNGGSLNIQFAPDSLNDLQPQDPVKVEACVQVYDNFPKRSQRSSMSSQMKMIDHNLSPSRKIKIMFNDLSQSNPFNNDDSETDRNHINSDLENFSDYKNSGKYPYDSLRKNMQKRKTEGKKDVTQTQFQSVLNERNSSPASKLIDKNYYETDYEDQTKQKNYGRQEIRGKYSSMISEHSDFSRKSRSKSRKRDSKARIPAGKNTEFMDEVQTRLLATNANYQNFDQIQDSKRQKKYNNLFYPEQYMVSNDSMGTNQDLQQRFNDRQKPTQIPSTVNHSPNRKTWFEQQISKSQIDDKMTPIDQTVPTWMLKRQSTPRGSGTLIADAHRIILDEKHRQSVSGLEGIDQNDIKAKPSAYDPAKSHAIKVAQYNQAQANKNRKMKQPSELSYLQNYENSSPVRRSQSPAKAIADENRAIAEAKKQTLVQKNRSKIESSVKWPNNSETNPSWLRERPYSPRNPNADVSETVAQNLADGLPFRPQRRRSSLTYLQPNFGLIDLDQYQFQGEPDGQENLNQQSFQMPHNQGTRQEPNIISFDGNDQNHLLDPDQENIDLFDLSQLQSPDHRNQESPDHSSPGIDNKSQYRTQPQASYNTVIDYDQLPQKNRPSKLNDSQIYAQINKLKKNGKLVGNNFNSLSMRDLDKISNLSQVKIPDTSNQKVFRGHQERGNQQLFCNGFDLQTAEKLEAVALGFRTRKIMKLKDAQDRMNFIKDHDQPRFKNTFEDRALIRDSRRNACKQLFQFIKTQENNGRWVQYFKSNRRPQPISKNLDPENSLEKGRMSVLDDLATEMRFKTRPSKRGSQYRQNQVKQHLKERDTKMIDIYANNKFAPKLNSDEYKRKAKSNLNKRMSYNPRESINISKSTMGRSSLAGGDFLNSILGNVKDQNQSVHVRKSKMMRKQDQDIRDRINQSVLVQNSPALTHLIEGTSNVFTKHFQDKSIDSMSHIKDGSIDSQNQIKFNFKRQAKLDEIERLERRKNYIPDRKRRTVMPSNYNTSASDHFARDFIQKKPLKHSFIAPLESEEFTLQDEATLPQYKNYDKRQSKILHVNPAYNKSLQSLDASNSPSKNRYIADQNRQKSSFISRIPSLQDSRPLNLFERNSSIKDYEIRQSKQFQLNKNNSNSDLNPYLNIQDQQHKRVPATNKYGYEESSSNTSAQGANYSISDRHLKEKSEKRKSRENRVSLYQQVEDKIASGLDPTNELEELQNFEQEHRQSSLESSERAEGSQKNTDGTQRSESVEKVYQNYQDLKKDKEIQRKTKNQDYHQNRESDDQRDSRQRLRVSQQKTSEMIDDIIQDSTSKRRSTKGYSKDKKRPINSQENESGVYENASTSNHNPYLFERNRSSSRDRQDQEDFKVFINENDFDGLLPHSPEDGLKSPPDLDQQQPNKECNKDLKGISQLNTIQEDDISSSQNSDFQDQVADKQQIQRNSKKNDPKQQGKDPKRENNGVYQDNHVKQKPQSRYSNKYLQNINLTNSIDNYKEDNQQNNNPQNEDDPTQSHYNPSQSQKSLRNSSSKNKSSLSYSKSQGKLMSNKKNPKSPEMGQQKFEGGNYQSTVSLNTSFNLNTTPSVQEPNQKFKGVSPIYRNKAMSKSPVKNSKKIKQIVNRLTGNGMCSVCPSKNDILMSSQNSLNVSQDSSQLKSQLSQNNKQDSRFLQISVNKPSAFGDQVSSRSNGSAVARPAEKSYMDETYISKLRYNMHINPYFEKSEMFSAVNSRDGSQDSGMRESQSKRSGSSQRRQPTQNKSAFKKRAFFKPEDFDAKNKYVKKYKGSNRKGPIDKPGFKQDLNLIADHKKAPKIELQNSEYASPLTLYQQQSSNKANEIRMSFGKIN